jgi:hypothetical protein
MRKKKQQIVTVIFMIAIAAGPLDAQTSQDVSPASSAAQLKSEKIQLQFQILESGGTIDFTTKNPGDSRTREALREYGKALEATLRQRQFHQLFAFTPRNPEFENAVTKRNDVGFNVIELPSGVRLDIATGSQAARTAVHEFIRLARGGGPLTAEEKRRNHPGTDLGRDAQPVDPAK